jgi:Ca2+-transporting ATPase
MAKSQEGEEGLSQTEAAERLAKFGPNQLVKPREIRFLDVTKEEVTEPMILLLLVVGVFYTVWGKWEDALTIFSIIFALVLVEIWNEYRAKKAITSLAKIAAPRTKVVREGKILDVETEKIVPDDILLLTPGTRIAADSKLSVSFSILIDESSLTGESLPKEKNSGDEVYAGTLVVSGEGTAKVFATAGNTRFGRISALAQQIREPKTPLQLAMKKLAGTLVWVALFFSILIPLFGILRGQNPRDMILTGLALAFATIPEEAPIIITMILGIGAYKLSHENFLVKKIKAAEVLGDATVILTDKTGTITENRMQVASTFPQTEEVEVVKTAMAAQTEISLSATDQAIMQKAKALKIDFKLGRILRERTFDSNRKTKSLVRQVDDNVTFFMSGAPEEILNLKKIHDNRAGEELRTETEKGRRVIAFAQKPLTSLEKNLPFQQLEKNLDFVGLVSFEDPPRGGVKETIELTRRAGIRTIMVTGDHPQTASFIARTVGIQSDSVLTGEDIDGLSDGELKKTVEEVSVYARTTPEHKYRIVKALRANNEVVAATGDGVNDTLALKGADIGIAMGVRGTDAAKEAADVVLADDNFVTIGHAVFEGRRFFDNLKKGLKYYLSVKTALVLIFFLPLVLNVPFPLAPIQIIVLELFMDLAASAGFVSEPAEKTVYNETQRNPTERFLDSRMLRDIAVSGSSLFAAVTASYFYGVSQNLPVVETQTFAFAAWIVGHIFLAFVSRSENEPLHRLGLFSNRIMTLWAVAAFVFLSLAVGIPSIGSQLKLASISAAQAGSILVITSLAILWQELVKILRFKRSAKS